MMGYLFLENSISELLNKIKNKEFALSDMISHSEEVYLRHENETNAWKEFDTGRLNKYLDDNNLRNLSGIPFGIKDIFNTSDFFTQMGSEIWKNFSPGNNARVVDMLIGAGAFPIGKTVTAEFAVHKLNETLNPHDALRTPGTSSSGSAAAVSRGVVPFALGTQTAGSIIRPASFCGVWGMKPSFGMIPRTGILKTTDSLDTVGFLTTHGKNMRLILDSIRVKGPNYPYVYNNVDLASKRNNKHWKVGFLKTNLFSKSEQYVQKSIGNFINKLSTINTFEVDEVLWPSSMNDLHSIHSTIYYKSLGYYFQREEKQSQKISDSMKQIINLSKEISLDDFQKALDRQEKFIYSLDELIKKYDFLITNSTASSAPLRNETEIDDTSLLWTMGHVPSISAPVFKCPMGLPFGIQFISRKWNDFNLINAIEELIDIEILPKSSVKVQ